MLSIVRQQRKVDEDSILHEVQKADNKKCQAAVIMFDTVQKHVKANEHSGVLQMYTAALSKDIRRQPRREAAAIAYRGCLNRLPPIQRAINGSFRSGFCLLRLAMHICDSAPDIGIHLGMLHAVLLNNPITPSSNAWCPNNISEIQTSKCSINITAKQTRFPGSDIARNVVEQHSHSFNDCTTSNETNPKQISK